MTATQEELDFIADNIPKGMVAVIMKRTGSRYLFGRPMKAPVR